MECLISLFLCGVGGAGKCVHLWRIPVYPLSVGVEVKGFENLLFVALF